jgi:hypothetical protein
MKNRFTSCANFPANIHPGKPFATRASGFQLGIFARARCNTASTERLISLLVPATLFVPKINCEHSRFQIVWRSICCDASCPNSLAMISIS